MVVADRFAALGVPEIDVLVAPLRDPGGPDGLREGLTESPMVPLEATLQCMRTLDRWRHHSGMAGSHATEED